MFFHQHQLGSKKSFVHILWSHYLVFFNVFVSNMYIHMSHNFLLLLFLIYVSFLIFLAGGTSISDYFFYLFHFSLLLVLWPVGSCFARAVSMLKRCKTLISVISFYLYPLLIFLGVFYVD